MLPSPSPFLNFYSLNPFIFIKNKWLFISSGGLFALEKNLDIFSEGNAAHPVGCESPLQILMTVWRVSIEFEFSAKVLVKFLCPL